MTSTSSARRPGEPAPDLIDYRVVHRAMTTDLDRLATAAADLVRHHDEKRFRALRYYFSIVSQEIESHHNVEDAHVWPQLVALDAEQAALIKLTDDHDRLDPLLHHTAALLRRDRSSQELVDTLRQTAVLLHRHIADEERDVFPMIVNLMTVADYKALQKQFRGNVRLRALPFLVVWALRHATPTEAAHMLDEAPSPFRLLHRLCRARFARRENLLFG